MCILYANRIRFIFFSVILFVLSCSTGDEEGITYHEAVPYSGSTSPAVISTRNAKQIALNIIGERDDNTSSASLYAQETHHVRHAPIKNPLQRLSSHSDMSQVTVSEVVDQTQPCSEGGTVTYSGQVDSNGLGTLDVSYDQCVEDGEKTSGTLKYNILSFDKRYYIETDVKMYNIDLKIQYQDESVDLGGRQHRRIDLASRSEAITENLTYRYNSTGILTKSQNLTRVTTYENRLYDSACSQTIDGRIFDSRHGHVNVETRSPMVFQTANQQYPDPGDSFKFSGANGTAMVTTSLINNEVEFSLDLDADGEMEMETVVPWQAVSEDFPNTIAPIADAGGSQLVKYRKTVALDGSDSRDPDYNFMDFSWSLIEFPDGSSSELIDATFPGARFVPDVPGVYRIRLTVSDGVFENTDDIVLTACEKDPQDTLQQWGTYQGNATHNGYVPLHLDPADFSLRWQRDFSGLFDVYPVTNGDMRTYVTSSETYGPKTLHVINSFNGEMLWEKELGSMSSISPPAYSYGVIYLQTETGSRSSLWAFNAKDASLIFKSDCNQHWSNYFPHTPFADDIYGGGYHTSAYSFDADDGAKNWLIDFDSGWDYCLPAIAEEHVYFYDKEGLSVLDRKTGALEYSIPDPDFVSSYTVRFAPVIGHDGHLLVLYRGRLICFDLENKSIAWQKSPGFSGQPAISRDTIYAVQDGILQALSEGDGSAKWSWQTPSGYVINSNLIATDTVIFAATFQATYAIDLTTRSLVWEYPVGGNLVLSNEGILLIESSRGQLIAIDVEGDVDNDGLPTWWERYSGLNDLDVADALLDSDGDGLDSLSEYQAQTHPKDNDSDGDGLIDGDEILRYSTDPNKKDSDADGINDSDEVIAYHTNPNSTDSDGDGLDDAKEINDLFTNPNSADSDGDGMDDPWEVLHGLDPLVNDAEDDEDGDGLTNAKEYSRSTDPNDADTDDDNLTDAEEVYHLGTSPVNEDTDNDLIEDGLEIDNTLNPLEPSDAKADLDGDGFSNLTEILEGFDHKDNLSKPVMSNWKTYQGNAAHTGFVPLVLDPSNFKVQWSVIPADGIKLNGISCGDGRIYATSSYSESKQLIVIKAIDGSILWRRHFGDISSVHPPAYNNGKIYVQTVDHSDSLVWAFNANDASLVFKVLFDKSYSQYLAPTPFKGNIYVGGGEKSGICSLDGSDGTQNWFLALARNDHFTPALDQDNLYIYSEGAIKAIDFYTGEIEYEISNTQTESVNHNVTPVIGHGKKLFVVSGGVLIGYDTSTRSMDWQITGVSSQLAIGPGIVYAVRDDVLEARKESDGTLFWTWSPPAGERLADNMVVTETLLFITSYDNTYAVDLNTHEAVWVFNNAGTLAIGNEGALIIAAKSGALISVAVDADTDDDLLPDSAELYTYGTDPHLMDTDNDGTPDGWELRNSLNPLENDSGLDQDVDDLDNLAEFLNHTDPNDPDTDNDNLSDGNELLTHGTNPLSVDTDDDFISDSLELAFGLNPLAGADATFDLDGDGYSALSEIYNGSDPGNKQSFPHIPDWSTWHGNAAHTGYVPMRIDPANITEKWNIVLEDYSDQNPVAMVGGRIYVTKGEYQENKSFFVVDQANGEILWDISYKDTDHNIISEPVYSNGLIYFLIKDYIYPTLWAYRTNDFSLSFTFQYDTNLTDRVPPTAYGDSIYVSHYPQGIYSIAATTGKLNWYDDSAGADEYAPTVHQDSVYVYGETGLCVIDRAAGAANCLIKDHNYKSTSGYRRNAAPAVGHMKNILVIQNSRLINFDLKKQEISWTIDEAFLGQPSLGPGVVYALNNGVVEARKQISGELLWTWAPASDEELWSDIIVSENMLFVGSRENTYAVELETKTEVWSCKAAGYLALDNDGDLVIATFDGRLMAITVDADTDMDQLADGAEIYTYGTDPDNEDSDGDGIPDGWEVLNGLNPLVDDANADEDADGLNNLSEFGISTDPQNSDSDKDALSDSEEFTVFKTDPNSADTDKDLILDNLEIDYDRSSPSNIEVPVIGHIQNILTIQDGRLISFDLDSRKIGWQIVEGFQDALALGPSVIYAINDGAMEAREERNGHLLWCWSAPSSNPLHSNIAVAENLLFAGTDSTTYAIEIETRNPVYAYPAAGHLAISDGVLYIAADDGRLISLDPE